MAKYPPIDGEFAQWYAQEFMEDGPQREKRWKAICDISTKATSRTVEVLVRLAFATKAAPNGHKDAELDAAYEQIISLLRAHDQPFDPSKHGRDLQVVSAAALVRLFKMRPDAALSVTTTAFRGSREPKLPMNLVGLAEQALGALSRRLHARVAAQEVCALLR